MIPVEWEQVFTIAYVTDQAGEVIFNYTKPGSDELNYYSDIPKDCNVSKDICKTSWFKVYRMFDALSKTSIVEELVLWTLCEFVFLREGKLNVSSDYTEWTNAEFDHLCGPLPYMNITLGAIPEMEYVMEEVK
ncbi:hypothetical protein EV43_15240, partial [Staphylococcus aureus]